MQTKKLKQQKQKKRILLVQNCLKIQIIFFGVVED